MVVARAVVFSAPAADTSATSVAEIVVPAPLPGQLLIDVMFAGINFKDVMARRGDAAYVREWPYVPGIEVAGTVRALGDGVSGFDVGQRVAAYMNQGGLADVAVAEASLTVPLPYGLDPALAASAPVGLTTAVLLLDRLGRLRAGESLLVHSAAGAVGQAIAQLARLRGSGELLAVVGASTRLAAAERAGYDRAFVRGPELAESVREHTGGRGVDLILDPQGTAMLAADVEIVAPAGRIVLFGNAGGEALEPLPPTGRLYAGNLSITGLSLAALSAAAPELLTAALSQAIGHLARGDLKPEVVLVDGLDAAPEAQQALAESRAGGKQVIRL